MFYLFIFEFLGTTELMVILVVALILFGPRRLPQMTRSLGKSLGEFKRASEEFQQTWEREVSLENVEREKQVEQAMLPEDNSILAPTVGREKGATAASTQSKADDEWDARTSAADGVPQDDAASATPPLNATHVDAAATEPTRKRDWL
jgi:sec-independent protein translocase protein TatB